MRRRLNLRRLTFGGNRRGTLGYVFKILFYTPEIPGNTGNAIRLAAVTGAELHLVEPLGFNFEDAHLRRAGLDYHDLAVVTVHKTLQDAWKALMPARVFAFTTTAARMRILNIVMAMCLCLVRSPWVYQPMYSRMSILQNA